MRESWKTATLFLATVLLLVAALEGLLHLLALAIPRVDMVLSASLESFPHTVPDDRLGTRPNPDFPGHDENGFRNSRVPARADIVALGDSQTYGTGVPGDAAWPRRLEGLTGKVVYGMAHGGYGPGHSLLLWDEAATLRPRVVVEAFYAGNDLYDSFNLVYNRRQLPDLRHADPEVERRVLAAEKRGPIGSRPLAGEGALPSSPPSGESGFSTRRLLDRYSRLHGLVGGIAREVRQVRQRIFPDAKWEKRARLAAADPETMRVFDDGRSRTVFTSARRLAALDQTDPRIAEGQRISLEAIARMSALALDEHVRFMVALIPTKELVFKSSVLDPSERFRRLIENEERLWATTVSFLEDLGVEYVDALPDLREALSLGNQPYPESRDGHPNRAGQRAIAGAVNRQLAATAGREATPPSR